MPCSPDSRALCSLRCNSTMRNCPFSQIIMPGIGTKLLSFSSQPVSLSNMCNFFVLVYAPCTRTAPVFFDCPASFVQLVKFNLPNLCSSSCGFLRRPHVWTILFFTFLPGFWIILYRPASNIQAPPAAFPQNSPLRFAHKTQGAGIFLISGV